MVHRNNKLISTQFSKYSSLINTKLIVIIRDNLSDKNKTLAVLAILFLAVVLFINSNYYVTAMIAFNDTNVTTVTVQEQGQDPSVTGVTVGPNPLTLTGGGNSTVACWATINDDNGAGDIQGGKGNITIYDEISSSATCTENGYNCYRNLTHSGSGSLNSAICETKDTDEVECNFTVDVYYNAKQSAEWKCHVAIDDTGGSGGTGTSATPLMVSPLTAININSTTMNFDSVAPGAVSGEVVMNIMNYGNIQLDMKFNGTNMSCDTGEAIVVGNISYNITGTSPVFGTTNLTNAISAAKDINIVPNTSTTDDSWPTPPSNNTWWRLYMPPSSQGARGSCSGTIWFIGTAG